MMYLRLLTSQLPQRMFGCEEVIEQVMDQPVQKEKHTITSKLLANAFVNCLFQTIVLLTLLWMPQQLGVQPSVGFQCWNEETGRHYCLLFNTLVMMQLFGIVRSKLFLSSVKIFILNDLVSVVGMSGVVIGLQVAILRWGGRVMRVVQLSVQEHILCAGLALVPMIISQVVIEVGKLFLRGQSGKKKKVVIVFIYSFINFMIKIIIYE